ncbi:MAG TPA: hypothetical protein VFQ39_04950 [Longimicrobium sp.]|nr:hypothetical protein [Longimicrobium sp.]
MLAKEAAESLLLALYQALRNVAIWSQTPGNRRGEIFHPLPEHARVRYEEAALAAPELAGVMYTFAQLQAAPESARADRLAVACNAVWEWADRRGLKEAATHFAEMAATVEDENPARAVVAGYATRLHGGEEMFQRSETWHARALALAIRNRDATEAVRALTGRGALYKDLGRVEEARRSYALAATRARYTKRRRQAAVVWHYIFALSVETESGDPVTEASTALDLYPIHDERLPALAFDLAYLLLRRNHPHAACRVLERTAGNFFDPAVTGLAFGALARAAAACGRTEHAMAAERLALQTIATFPRYEAQTLVNLSEASRSLRAWDRAAEFALRGAKSARVVADRQVEALALAAYHAAFRCEPSPPALHLQPDSPLALLARRCAARLRRWRRRERSRRKEVAYGASSGQGTGM